MPLFKGKFKFLTYTTIGLIYDIIGVLIITLLYNPVVPNYGMHVGQLYGALYNPDKILPSSAMWFIFIGFTCLLVDHLITIYKPKKIISSLLKILLIFSSLYILYSFIYVLIKIIIIITTKHIT